MLIGTVGRLGIFVSCALVALGCSSPSDAGPSCGTTNAPDLLAITNLQPALGASVPNAAIVQTFTIAGRHLELTPSFALGATHTAGLTAPSPVHWTISLSGADTLYTAEPVTWVTAPGHVELNPPGQLESNGCILTLPSPMFSYDVTAP